MAQYTLEEEDTPGILLTWTPVGVADKYTVEVAADKEFKKILKKFDASDNKYYWHHKIPGIYWIRYVAYRTEFNYKSELSKPKKVFYYGPTPELYEPKHLGDGSFKLKWSSNYRYFQIDVSTTATFKKIKSVKTKGLNKIVNVSKPGTYFVRLRGLSKSTDDPITKFTKSFPLFYKAKKFDKSKEEGIID